MDDAQLSKAVDAWIAAVSAEEGSPQSEANWWAVSQVSDWSLDGDGNSLWPFILACYQRELSEDVIAVLAAGPVEDLLAKRGADFIDRVEELARKDPKFNYVLGGVWRNAMTDDVWQRVQSIRNQVW